MARIFNMICNSSVLLLVLLVQLQLGPVSTRSLIKRSDHSSSNTSTVETHRLMPTGDVTLGNLGLKNNNHLPFLSIGKKARYPIQRALLKFEDIPESCKYIEKAEMFVYYFEAHKARWHTSRRAPFFPRKIEVRQVLKDWNENKATKIMRMEAEKWKKPYLEFNNTDAKIDADDSHTIYPEEPVGYIKFDITTTAQKWSSGEDNFGLILSAENQLRSGREIRIHSRESGDINGQEVKPHLKIKCWTNFCAPGANREDEEEAGGGGGGDGEARGSIKMTSGGTEYWLPANSLPQHQDDQ